MEERNGKAHGEEEERDTIEEVEGEATEERAVGEEEAPAEGQEEEEEEAMEETEDTVNALYLKSCGPPHPTSSVLPYNVTPIRHPLNIWIALLLLLLCVCSSPLLSPMPVLCPCQCHRFPSTHF